MEKYSRFRDEGTGIAPFQAARRNSQDFGIAQLAVLYIVGSISTAAGFLGIVTYFLFFHWILPGPLAHVYVKVFIFVPLRLFYITFYYDGERRASVRKKSIRKAQPGDVILTNFTSPLDILVYESQLKAVKFVFPTTNGKFEAASTFSAFNRALSASSPAPSGELLESITAKAKRSGAIVVLFVEGTTSNGRGLLTLKDLGVERIAKVDTQVYAAAVKYTPATASAPVPSSLLSYVWHMATSTWWYMASVKVSGEPVAKAGLSRDAIAKSIAGIGRLRILGDRLDVAAKQQYCTQRGGHA